MMTPYYVLDRIEVNGFQVPGPEISLVMDCDKVIIATYEVKQVSVTMKNTGTEDKTVIKVTITVEPINIPAGGTVTIPYDPTHDVIEIS